MDKNRSHINFDDKSVMAAFDTYDPAKLSRLPDNPLAEDLECRQS